jgi:hypothetical protein
MFPPTGSLFPTNPDKSIDDNKSGFVPPAAPPKKKSRCYIATATIVGGSSEVQLAWLRSWRDDVMRSTRIGCSLEAFYDMTGPLVAAEVMAHPILAASFLHPLVRPATWLASRRRRNRIRVLFDALIYALFLVGLAYGSIIYLLCRGIQAKHRLASFSRHRRLLA